MSILGSAIVPHPPLIVPEIGKGNEKEIQNTINSYKEVSRMINELSPDTIIIISPHGESYEDAFKIYTGDKGLGDFEMFGSKEVSFSIDYDEDLILRIVTQGKKEHFPITTGGKTIELDHGAMVPLYFINQDNKNYKIVRISLSGYNSSTHFKFGKLIARALDNYNKKVFIIASGDLSHKLKETGPYGFHPAGPIYDKKVMEDISSCNFKNLFTYDKKFIEEAAICGHKGFCIMAGILDNYKLEARQLSYEGPFGVGYGVCTYKVLKEKEDEYIALARKAIEEYIKNKTIIKIENISAELQNNKAGVFVSIHKNGMLRGCIGTIMAMQTNIAEEIISNAISAATNDKRFTKVTEEELDFLEIKVDVLKQPELIHSKEELDTKKYGVIVSTLGKRGLLLPNLEGIDTVDEQISIALKKGSIDPNEDYMMERFEVIRHEPDK